MRYYLKEARLLKKLTHAQIACKAGLERTSYTNIERGIRNPSKKVEIKIRIILENENDNLFLNE